MEERIHLISKDYYSLHRGKGFKKILVPYIKFPNVKNQFFMTSGGECFMYLQNLGFLITNEDSTLDSGVLSLDLDSSMWYLEKYNQSSTITKNYVNAFPDIDIYNTNGRDWLVNYEGWLRVWNTFTLEDFIFYKTAPSAIYGAKNSYLCKLVTGFKVKFPIDIYKAKEFNNLMKDILEWI